MRAGIKRKVYLCFYAFLLASATLADAVAGALAGGAVAGADADALADAVAITLGAFAHTFTSWLDDF